MQLTGTRISDMALTKAITAVGLFDAFGVREKGKKLAQEPQVQRELMAIPNVKLYGSRVSMKQKEEEIGRWKVIKRELLARGLPLDKADSKFKQANEGVRLRER